MVAAMAASISCRPAPLRVFAARRPAARPMRAGYRVFAAVDKVQVRLWVVFLENVPKCRAFRPADWRQIVSFDTCVLTRNVTRSGSCSACADCSINFTQLTVYALGKRPVVAVGGKELAEQCKRPLAWLQPLHSRPCAAGPLVGRTTGSVVRPGTVIMWTPYQAHCGPRACLSGSHVWSLAARLAGLAQVRNAPPQPQLPRCPSVPQACLQGRSVLGVYATALRRCKKPGPLAGPGFLKLCIAARLGRLRGAMHRSWETQAWQWRPAGPFRVVHRRAPAQVLEDVRGIIAEQLGTDLAKVTPDSKFVDLGADSLDTVEIMMALEEKFDLQLDEEGAEKISTVQVRRLFELPSLPACILPPPRGWLGLSPQGSSTLQANSSCCRTALGSTFKSSHRRISPERERVQPCDSALLGI